MRIIGLWDTTLYSLLITKMLRAAGLYATLVPTKFHGVRNHKTVVTPISLFTVTE